MVHKVQISRTFSWTFLQSHPSPWLRDDLDLTLTLILSLS